MQYVVYVHTTDNLVPGSGVIFRYIQNSCYSEDVPLCQVTQQQLGASSDTKRANDTLDIFL